MWPHDIFEFSRFEDNLIDNICSKIQFEKLQDKSYYSDELRQVLIEILEEIKQSNYEYSYFYSFLYPSLTKELYCYRAGQMK